MLTEKIMSKKNKRLINKETNKMETKTVLAQIMQIKTSDIEINNDLIEMIKQTKKDMNTHLTIVIDDDTYEIKRVV